MKQANYSKIGECIRMKASFMGNSAHAEVVNGDYQIFSYATLIYSSKDNYFNTNHFSVTTSKIQGLIASIIFNTELKAMRKAKEIITKKSK